MDIGTQCWADLHGITLKNNELNVVIAGIRHWGLAVICILYAAWQRGISADIFAAVHDDNMTQDFFVHDCALQTSSCTRKFRHWQNVICSSVDYDQYASANEFIDSLFSQLFLPHILKPTRVRHDPKILMDYVFSNAISSNIIFGNLTSSITDYLPKFLIAPNIFSTPL